MTQESYLTIFFVYGIRKWIIPKSDLYVKKHKIMFRKNYLEITLHTNLQDMIQKEEKKIGINVEHMLPDYFNGTLSEDERSIVERWRDANGENQSKFDDALNLFLDVQAFDVYKRVDVDKAWHRVNRRMKYDFKRILKILRNCAAVLFVPICVAAIWLILDASKDSAPTMLELRTSPGMTGCIVLPDSTKVILNSGSILRYPSEFTSKCRDVELIGEGYFEVKKDSDRRFVVSLPGRGMVTVYGTVFDVSAYENSNVVTTLVEGSVGYKKMNGPGYSEEYRLTPNQTLTHSLDNGEVRICDMSCESAIAWKDNRIILDSTSFEEILKLMERKYSVKFIIDNPNLGNQTFSGGTMTYCGLENMLEMLRISTGINWSYEDVQDNGNRIIRVY